MKSHDLAKLLLTLPDHEVVYEGNAVNMIKVVEMGELIANTPGIPSIHGKSCGFYEQPDSDDEPHIQKFWRCMKKVRVIELKGARNAIQ